MGVIIWSTRAPPAMIVVIVAIAVPYFSQYLSEIGFLWLSLILTTSTLADEPMYVELPPKPAPKASAHHSMCELPPS